MRRRKVSETVKQYRKERKRVREAIRRMKERGYTVPEDILPEIPKKITAGSVRRLKKITSQRLYDKSTYTRPVTVIDPNTGEVVGHGQETVPAVRARGWARSPKTREYLEGKIIVQEPPRVVDIILEKVRDVLEDAKHFVSNSAAYTVDVREKANYISDILEGRIKEWGLEVVADRLEKEGSAIYEPLKDFVYAYGETEAGSSHGKLFWQAFDRALDANSLEIRARAQEMERARALDQARLYETNERIRNDDSDRVYS